MIVYRREIKYALSDVDYLRYVNIFSNVLTPDKNNKDGGYTIRSLYFDSIEDCDYVSKMDGDEIRKKIRLRIYNPNDKTAKLEIKRKLNVNQIKETATISREDAISLINKDYSVLLKYDNNTTRTAYNIMTIGQYVPVVLIDYNRRAFMHKENDIRLTLDSNIRASETQFNMFDENLLLTPVFDRYDGLLEIKYNGELFKWIRDVINGLDVTNQSLSKYCSSRKFFEEYIY